MIREMSTSYGRSYFGYLWTLLEPLGGIAILSIAFSMILVSPSVGDNFALFYATGFLPFTMFHKVQLNVSKAIEQNRQLLFYPEVGYTDAIFGRLILTATTELVGSIVILSGIILLFGIRLYIELPGVALSLAAAMILGLGVGTVNSVLQYILPSWANLWSIATRPLFIISGIFYTFDTLPLWARESLWYNPLIHIIGQMRKGVYNIYHGDYVTILYPILLGGGLFLLGLILLRNFAKGMIND